MATAPSTSKTRPRRDIGKVLSATERVGLCKDFSRPKQLPGHDGAWRDSRQSWPRSPKPGPATGWSGLFVHRLAFGGYRFFPPSGDGGYHARRRVDFHLPCASGGTCSVTSAASAELLRLLRGTGIDFRALSGAACSAKWVVWEVCAGPNCGVCRPARRLKPGTERWPTLSCRMLYAQQHVPGARTDSGESNVGISARKVFLIRAFFQALAGPCFWRLPDAVLGHFVPPPSCGGHLQGRTPPQTTRMGVFRANRTLGGQLPR